MLKRNWIKFLLVLIDIALVNFAFILSFNFSFLFDIPRYDLHLHPMDIVVTSLIFLVFFYIFKLYDSLWNFASLYEFMMATAGCVSGGMIVIILNMSTGHRLPNSIVVLASMLITILVVGFRVTFRVYRRVTIYLNNRQKDLGTRVMIVGAGSGGHIIYKEMVSSKELNMKPVCFIDDSENKIGNEISGVKIMGNRYDIERIVQKEHIDMIIIAIPTLTGESKAELIEICRATGCKLKIMPGIYELLNGKVSIKTMRDVEVEDLLGRSQVKLVDAGISTYLKNKTVIVTGGGGSIGSELCRQIARFSPEKLIIFDIYENNAYEIENEFKKDYPHMDTTVLIGSIRDRRRLDNIFKKYKPQVVFHAAAHKHVPLMEYSPSEAVKNNVFGTFNLVEVSDKYKVEKFVMISTDKAVNPTNVMGATKRICEMIIQAAADLSSTEFGAVRFGNVLGSNGSVIPLFKRQIARGGPVTVTDKRITRFFMTIPEASQLVLQAGAYARGGEIFILDMGQPVRIYDLAKDLIKLSGFEPEKDISIEFTGLRPGEKLYEEVLMNEEGMATTAHNKIFVAKPHHYNMEELKKKLEELKFICEGGNKEEIRKKLHEIVPTYQRQAIVEAAATLEQNIAR